ERVMRNKVGYAGHIATLGAVITSLGGVPGRWSALHANGVYGEAKAWQGGTPQEVERVADGLRARGVGKLILPALYL
ncbi:YjjW family glycine radical enzyme activase, partial [Salmonella enterica subsp. enterica serovar Enteritidis]|nr:YjjW family glycine radical enzyme activase [Salmonella enterica subsp. enterica serovar Enteritidis]